MNVAPENEIQKENYKRNELEKMAKVGEDNTGRL